MPPLPLRRTGSVLVIKDVAVPFSLWPMTRTTRRYSLHYGLYASEPWSVIKQSINTRCPSSEKLAAHAFLSQSEEFFSAAKSAKSVVGKPLLLYYCFLNLVKSYLLVSGQRKNSELDKARHGIADMQNSGVQQIDDAFLRCHPSPDTRGRLNMFDEFYKAVSGNSILSDTDYNLKDLMPQLLPGHRLWVNAQSKSQRFFRAHRLEFLNDPTTKALWINMYFRNSDLAQWGIKHRDFLSQANLNTRFREVKCEEECENDRLLCFEQIAPATYTGRPADIVQSLVNQIQATLWATVTTAAPYRAYYIYMSPISEHGCRVPQLLSIYSTMYYFGSITRYRPHQFESVLSGKYASQVYEVLTGAPNQFLYLMASRFSEQEIVPSTLV